MHGGKWGIGNGSVGWRGAGEGGNLGQVGKQHLLMG